MRRRRRSMGAEDEAEVAMSPLIDCVFLLLIFFLVTTVIKRKEKQIKVEMPDTTAAISEKTNEETLVIGMNDIGENLAIAGRGEDGEIKWGKIDDLSKYLQKQIQAKGAQILDRPLRIDADREVLFQEAIDTLDICKLMGFTKVSVKIKQREGAL